MQIKKGEKNIGLCAKYAKYKNPGLERIEVRDEQKQIFLTTVCAGKLSVKLKKF